MDGEAKHMFDVHTHPDFFIVVSAIFFLCANPREGRKCGSTGNIWCFLTSWMSKLGMKDLTLAAAKYVESVCLNMLTLDCFKWRYILYIVATLL